MIWRRSSFCDAGACLEVARADGQALLRETRSGGILHLTEAELDAFLAGVKLGEFDKEETVGE